MDLQANLQLLSENQVEATAMVEPLVVELRKELLACECSSNLYQTVSACKQKLIADVVLNRVLPNIRVAQEQVFEVLNRPDPREDGGGFHVDRSWGRCMEELVEVLNAFERGQFLFNNSYGWAIGNFLTKLQGQKILYEDDLPATIDPSLLPRTFTEAKQLLSESSCLAAPIKRYYQARDLFTYEPKIGTSSSALGYQVNLVANMYSELITNYKKAVFLPGSRSESLVTVLDASLKSCGLDAAFLDWKFRLFYNRNDESFVVTIIQFMGLPTELAFDGTQRPMADNQFFKALLVPDFGPNFDFRYRRDILYARCTASQEYLQDANNFMQFFRDNTQLDFEDRKKIIKEAASLIDSTGVQGLHWMNSMSI